MTNLLFIHGLGSSTQTFDNLRAQPAIQALGGTALDLPGYGSNANVPMLAEPLEEALSFLTDYINALDEPVTLIGHSMGGALSILLASRMPDKIKSLLVFEATMIAGDCNILTRNLANAATPQDQLAMKNYLMAFAKTLTPSWQAWADDVAVMNETIFTHYARDLVKLADTNTLPGVFSALECPKLYVYGDNYVGNEALSLLPENAVKYVPHSGHFVMQDQPELSAEIIVDFIRQP